ncbi:MAG TPA: hypothetical protein VN716_08695, partial [Vicinamibacterales bacterium]|nr:hypothetical protein [Vicinamibacterales bacterium]
MVSCVLRRSARSDSFSSSVDGSGMPSPPIVSASESARRQTRARKRQLTQFFLAGAGRHRQAAADLAVHLHRDDDLVGLGHGLVELRP